VSDTNGRASSRGAIILQIAYLVLLAAPVVLLVWCLPWLRATRGPIPIGVPWFGARWSLAAVPAFMSGAWVRRLDDGGEQ
jgi:hypothetical protein